MSKEIQVFNNDQFGKIRTLLSDSNEPLFCAKDVAASLGYSDTSDAIARHCKSGKKVFHPHSNCIGGVNMTYISEKDVYRLIMRSNLPDAEKFQDWVCDEVLPSIRKNGAYMTESTIEKAITSPDFLIQLATKLKDEQQKRIAAETLVLEAQPKVEFYDAVTDSKDVIDMAQVAKVLNMGVGRNRLFAILRDNNILTQRNAPMQQYVDNGWLRCVESHYTKPNGDTCINIKTVVFQKGLDGIRKLLNKLKRTELRDYDDV